mmetsp:Transcript_43271/g.78766  ORF Transcript_43271/g.78766 Transcript_43271/m.78766 type:complete len:1074 (-) Transcript_43271:52-3273(-)
MVNSGLISIPERSPTSSILDVSFSARSLDDALRQQALMQSGLSQAGRIESETLQRRAWKVMPLCIRVLVHMAFFGLRLACLGIFCLRRRLILASIQGCLEMIGTVIACKATWEDADVRRWVAKFKTYRCSCLWRLVARTISLACFGVLRCIHLKRAWAQQLHVAEVLRSAQHRVSSWAAGPILGAERALPATLLTGVPSTLLTATEVYWSCNQFLGVDCFLNSKQPLGLNWQATVCAAATIAGALSLTVSAVGVDLSVSRYVRAHHQARGSYWRPGVHALFRLCEVLLRIATFTKLLALGRSLYGGPGLLLAMSIPILDVVIATVLLWRNAPKEEAFALHLLASFGLLLTNAARFLDIPCCRLAAERVSRRLEFYRLCTMGLGFGALAGLPLLQASVYSYHPNSNWDQVLDSSLAGFLGAYLCLGCLPPIRRVGHDLHSAAQAGRVDEVRRLLRPGLDDELLDVNADTKDRLSQVPLMLAAQSGHVEVVKELLAAGARLSIEDSCGRTSIHYAVKHLQWECLEVLTSQPAAAKVLQNDDVLDSLLSMDTVRKLSAEETEHLRTLLAGWQCSRHSPRSAASSYQHAGHFTGELQSVRARLTIGLHVKKLFPNIEAGHSDAALHELRSVSAVLVATALGPLVTGLLPLPRGERLLEALIPVGPLGKGGQGKVLEVEYKPKPDTWSGGFRQLACPLPGGTGELRSGCWGQSSQMDLEQALQQDASRRPKRFAMKLQAKKAAPERPAAWDSSSTGRTTDVVPDKWQACSEALALQRVAHPFIVRLHLAFQTQHYYILLLELCPGGSLNRVLCEPFRASNGELSQVCAGLPVARAARYAGQALIALEHLHQHLFVYRDVKPENLLLSRKDEVKLADFGLALRLDNQSSGFQLPRAGTMGFLAPELVLGSSQWSSRASSHVESFLSGEMQISESPGTLEMYFKADSFSFGVTLALLLLGEAVGDIVEERGEVYLLPWALDDGLRGHAAEAALNTLQADARQLLTELLHANPNQRMSLADAMSSDFFLQTLQCADLKKHLLRNVISISVVGDESHIFNESRHFAESRPRASTSTIGSWLD